MSGQISSIRTERGSVPTLTNTNIFVRFRAFVFEFICIRSLILVPVRSRSIPFVHIHSRMFVMSGASFIIHGCRHTITALTPSSQVYVPKKAGPSTSCIEPIKHSQKSTHMKWSSHIQIVFSDHPQLIHNIRILDYPVQQLQTCPSVRFPSGFTVSTMSKTPHQTPAYIRAC